MTDNYIMLSQKISDFIAKAKSDQHLLSLDGIDFSHRFDEKESGLDNVFRHISDEINRLKTLMTHAVNAQWHQDTEKLLYENKNEITAIGSLYHEAHSHIAQQCDRLNHATMSTIKNTAQIVSSVKNSSLQKFAENKYQELEKACENNVSRLKNTLHSLRWKNLATAFCLSVLVSFIVSFYIDNESPWLAHKEVIKQREEGRVLLASWQHLSKNDRNSIIQSA